MKKIISLLLVCITVVSVLSVGVINTAASSKTYPVSKKLADINDFKQTLTGTQYNVLCYGKIKAEKIGKTWYYRFTKDEYYLRVKVSAFSGAVSNNYSGVNSSLSKGLASTQSSASPVFYYKNKSTTKQTIMPLVKNNMLGKKTTKITTKIGISKLNVNSSLSGHQVLLQCFTNNYVCFTFNNYIANTLGFAKESGIKGSGYIKPNSAAQYAEALRRTCDKGSCCKITPKFSVSVDKAGSNKVILKEFYYKSIGRQETKEVVDKLINVAYTTKVIVDTISAKQLPVKPLYDLFYLGIELRKSGAYLETPKMLIQKGKTKLLKADFKSPVSIKNKDNYVEVNLNLSDSPSTKGTKTVLSAYFSI